MDDRVDAKEPMSASPKYLPVPGSEKTLPAGAKLVGPVDPGERIEVTFLLRAKAEPPAAGPAETMSREEYAARYGAAQGDLDRVTAFARGAGLAVVFTSQPQKTVVVAGPAAKVLAAVHADLCNYQQAGRRFRGRQGAVELPSDLTEVVVGVFGLDDRPVGKGT